MEDVLKFVGALLLVYLAFGIIYIFSQLTEGKKLTISTALWWIYWWVSDTEGES